MLVYFNTQPKVILSKAAALAAAKEGIIKKYPRIVADSLKLSASFDSATEVWTGYAEGIEAGVVSTPIVVSSSIFEDTAVDFEAEDAYYLYEEIVNDCKREAINRLRELGKFTKITFQTHDETDGEMRRIWVTATATM